MQAQSRIRVGLAVALLLDVTGALPAYGAGEQVGQIRGRVVEQSTDLPVPGATVTATAPNLGNPRTVTTDDNGEFLIPDLPIGHYTVAISYSGVKPITRAVLVDPGVTSPLEIKWSAELANVETTTVVEERPVTNPDSSQTGAVVSFDVQKYIPGSRDFRNAVEQVPGTRLGVRSPVINGGRETDNRYLVDGLETTDPIERSMFRQRISVESVQAEQVITGGFSAEYNSMGGVINTITKEGSDEWHGGASIWFISSALSGRTPQGSQPFEFDQPFNRSLQASSYSHYDAVWLGGPIIPGHLWFHFTFEYRYEKLARLQGPPVNFPKVPQYNYYYWPQLKITWVPTPKQRVTTSVIADPSFLNNTVTWNDRLSLYRDHTDEGGYNISLSYNYFPTANFEVRVDTGFKKYWQHEGPQPIYGTADYSYCDQFSARNCTYDREAPTHVNNDDGSVWYNGNQDVNRNHRYNYQIDPKVILRGQMLGQHALRTGLQLRMLQDHRTIHTPGLYTYADRGGGPLEDGVCDPDNGKTLGCDTRTFIPDRQLRIVNYNPGFFLQDEWRLTHWLAIMPGIRFDYGRTVLTDGTVFNSQFAVGPRIGAVLDITRDQKTILSANYGRSNDVTPFDTAANYDSALKAFRQRDRWNRTTNQWEFLDSSGGAGGLQIDKNAKVPHSDQLSASFRREIFLNTVAELGYVWKRMSNIWGTVEINRIWDHTGFRIADFRDGINHTIDLYTAPNANTRKYHGFNFAIQGRPTPNWYVMGFYTLSWLYGTTENSVPAQAKFNNGYLQEDQRHRISLATSYTFGFGLTVGIRGQHNSGGPRLATNHEGEEFQVSSAYGGGTRLRTPRGTAPGVCAGSVPGQGNFSPWTTVCGNNVDLISEIRVPASTTLDVQLTYDVYPLLRQHVAITAEISNVLSERTKNGVLYTDRVAGDFGYASGSEGSWGINLGLRYEF
jgi:hypothetical protein